MGPAGHPATFCGTRSLQQLCSQVPGKIIRWTSIGVIRSAGGDVVMASRRTPDHATLIGLRTLPDISNNEVSPSEESLPMDVTGFGASNQNAPRIFADFNNADKQGRVRLNTRGAIEDFRAIGVEPTVGMHVLLDDMEEFCTEGVIEYDEIEGWVAKIDWDKLKAQS
jgi:hypothetical protein